MTEISGFGASTGVAANDLLLSVDVSNHSMASSGTDVKATVSQVGLAITNWADLVRDFGADPTGTTSASTALASACSAATAAQPAPYGLKVPPGYFKITAHQDLPYNLIMQGAGAVGGDVTQQYIGSVFQVATTFTDTYAFGFKDTPHVTGATGTNGARVSGIFVDGGATGASHQTGAIDGFYLYGPTMCTFSDIRIARMTGWGVNASGVDNSMAESFPFGQTWTNLQVNSCGVVSGGGINLNGCEDSVFLGCYSIGNNNGPGFQLNGCDNTKLIGCNAEWNSNYGFYVTGDWQWFTGGCQFIGCSTDANGQYGFYQDATWTTGGGAGTGPGIINVIGGHFRRDGQNTFTNSAGIAVGATTLPLIINGFSTMPSIGDGGSGSMAPEYGLYFTQSAYTTPLLVSSGLAWGLTGAIQHGAGGGGSAGSGFPTGATNSAILLAHGNNYAPTYGSLQGGGRPAVPPLLQALQRAEHVVGPLLALYPCDPRVVADQGQARVVLADAGLLVHHPRQRGALRARLYGLRQRRDDIPHQALRRLAQPVPERAQPGEEEPEGDRPHPELKRVALVGVVNLHAGPAEQDHPGDQRGDQQRHQSSSGGSGTISATGVPSAYRQETSSSVSASAQASATCPAKRMTADGFPPERSSVLKLMTFIDGTS